MDRPGDTKIFISYAHKDGAELARRLRSNLIRESFDAWLDERRLEAGASWTDEIEQAIDNSQVVLALMSPGSYSSEICRAEQLRSLRKGKRVIPLLAASGSEIPLYLEARQYRDFTGANRYASEFNLLLEDITGGAGVALKNEYRETRVAYVTAPPRVTNYIERPEDLRALRDELFADRQRQPLAITALAGMGGIGKTVLAQALMRDSLVQDAFPDGVAWITIGKEGTADLLAGFREVGKALGDDLRGYETLPAAINRYKTVLAQKAVLIVVDDVWKEGDLKPFLADSERSRLLFTTRHAFIARSVGAREYTANLLSLEQARELVSAWAELDGRPPQLDALIRECGNLPLALSTMGAMLKTASPAEWEDAIRLLRTADLTAIKGRLPPGQESFFRTVDVSFNWLAADMQTRYGALAILLEDMVAPLPILRTLWGVPDAKALETSRHFVERSLALRVDDTGAIRLHDLQLDYVRAQHPDPEALDLIHTALQLSQHVIARDPAQFASQMAGRLLPYVQPINALQQLAGSAARAAPRLIHAVLCIPLYFLLSRREMVWFASEIIRRLQAYVRPDPTLQPFVSSVVRAAPRPWLRPLQPTLDPPGGGLVRTLAGRPGSVAVTEDGSRAVSVSVYSKTITMWDLKTGRELQSLAVDLGKQVVVSGDGRRAASWGEGWSASSIKLWDLETGRELRTLGNAQLHLGNPVSMSRDGRQLVYAFEKMIRAWDCETGRELQVLTAAVGPGHDVFHVKDLAVSGDGRRVVAAPGGRAVQVLDLETGRELLRKIDHFHDCRLAMSGSGQRVLCATPWDLIVWDLETGRELRFKHDQRSWREEPGTPHLAVSWDGRLAVSGARGLKVWDLETGHEVRTLGDEGSDVWNLAMNRDGSVMVSGYEDGLKVWSLRSGRELRPPAGHGNKVTSVAGSGNGRRAVSASRNDTFMLWDPETGRHLRGLFQKSSNSQRSNSVAVSFDGRRAVSAWSHRSFLGRSRYGLMVWSLKRGRKLRTLAGHSDAVLAVALSRDGRRALSASEDLTLKLWDLKKGRELRTLTGHAHPVVSVAMSGDGRRALSASVDGNLKVWDLEAGKVWDLEAGKAMEPPKYETDRYDHERYQQEKEFRAVALTGDGQRAVTSSWMWDYELTVWDVERGRKLRTMAGHSDRVSGLAVSADGEWVVSTSADKTLKVWRFSTGELVTGFTCDAPALCCAFAGHNRIVAGDDLGRVHFLALELDETLAQ
jgi:WD40 repeat protein